MKSHVFPLLPDLNLPTGRTGSVIRARSWLWLPLALKVSARTRGQVSPTRWMKMLSLPRRLKHSSELQLVLGWEDTCMIYQRINGFHTTIPLGGLPSLRSFLTGLFQRKNVKTATLR